MQLKFTTDQIMIMDLLVHDATHAARDNREVFRRGKRLLVKLSITAEYINLKKREIRDIAEILKFTISLAEDIDPEKDKGDDKENREANLETMRSSLGILEAALC